MKIKAKILILTIMVVCSGLKAQTPLRDLVYDWFHPNEHHCTGHPGPDPGPKEGPPPGSPGHEPLVNETYTVICRIGGNPCRNPYSDSFEAIDDEDEDILSSKVENELIVYPNPFIDKITVFTGGLCKFIDGSQMDNCYIELYNSNGEIISKYNLCSIEVANSIDVANVEFNLNNYPNGIYFVRIGLFTKKIIKQ